jgi:hypothetical protein
LNLLAITGVSFFVATAGECHEAGKEQQKAVLSFGDATHVYSEEQSEIGLRKIAHASINQAGVNGSLGQA